MTSITSRGSHLSEPQNGVPFVFQDRASMPSTLPSSESRCPSGQKEHHFSLAPGKLYIIPTPIGNRQDITLRALEILRSVDSIAAEDTRHSRALLQHYGISKPLFSLHQSNEDSRSLVILEKLQQGLNIALVSDAGTPLISDPGFPLVQRAREQGITVIPLPGPCALITALSASGLPCDHFLFEGFLPASRQARKTRLQQLQHQFHTTHISYTLVFYEAPHRILALFKDIQAVFGDDYRMAFAKELTKVFEHFFLGNISEAITWLEEQSEHQKGEFVVMLPGKPAITSVNPDNADIPSDNISINLTALLKILLTSLPLKQAVQLAMEISGEKKNKVYSLALTLHH